MCSHLLGPLCIRLVNPVEHVGRRLFDSDGDSQYRPPEWILRSPCYGSPPSSDLLFIVVFEWSGRLRHIGQVFCKQFVPCSTEPRATKIEFAFDGLEAVPTSSNSTGNDGTEGRAGFMSIIYACNCSLQSFMDRIAPPCVRLNFNCGCVCSFLSKVEVAAVCSTADVVVRVPIPVVEQVQSPFVDVVYSMAFAPRHMPLGCRQLHGSV